MFKKKNAYKSTTANNKCINPVFEKWILEWRDDAVAKDLQSKHTYTKCLNSMRKYPLPLNSGKECVILEGFGDKICKSIDEKLKNFLEDGGILHEVDLIDSESSCDEITVSKNSKNKPRNHEVINEDVDDLISVEKDYSSNIILSTKSSNSLIKISEKNKADDNFEKKANKKPKTSNNTSSAQTGKRTYIPEYRSGPYSLIVALFNNEIESSNSDMLKKDLITEAQKHCSSSFTSTDPNSHYSAWNSMSSLIKKNLVIKENKLPARYKLTEEGRKLASIILYGADENDEVSPIEKAPQIVATIEENEDSSNEEKRIPSVIEKPAQKTKKDDVIELLSDSDSDIITIGDKSPNNIISSTKAKETFQTKKTFSKNYDSSESDSLPDIGIEVKSNYQNYVEKSPIKIIPSKNVLKIGSSSQQSTERPSSSTNLTQKLDSMHTSSSQSSYTSKFTETSYLKNTQNPSALYSFAPGTFDIMLFVDNCEQSHAKRQDLLIDELKKSKIKFDIGKLNVGDFTWIARSKNAKKDDIILDFIVERKRMDDFCQSIIDGRYKEQKFRIKKCGITKIIYLIEEFGSIKHMSLPDKSLIQADVNTQLIDHLIVHHTTDPKDSAHYLIEMTIFITKNFENLTINACTKEQVDNFNKNNIGMSTNLMTFDEFNKFSNKNKPLTIKEMFAKCLMKIQGVSQEKCLAIIDVYPTPQSLFREYSKCSDSSKREKLLANLKYGLQQRNIGPAISKLIAQLLYSNEPLN